MNYANNNGTVKVKEINGERVLSFRDIITLTKLSNTGLRKRFDNVNAKLNEDYYVANKDVCRKIFGKAYGAEVTVLTKSGFELLMKPKENDMTREIITGYFLSVPKLPEKSSKVIEKIVKNMETEKIAESGDSNQQRMFEALLEVTKMCLENQQRLIETHEKIIFELLSLQKQKAEIENFELESENTHCLNEYLIWKKSITHAVEEIVKISKKYENANAVLHEAYNRMRQHYGVCWEQERKEYGKKAYSNLILAYQLEKKNPTCENLLLSVLGSMYEEERKGI